MCSARLILRSGELVAGRGRGGRSVQRTDVGDGPTIAGMFGATSVGTWLFSLGGVVIGVAVGHLSGRAADRRRFAAEDARRWLSERRALYARYLALVEGLQRSADDVACLLRDDDGSPPVDGDAARDIRERSNEWIGRWQDEVLPMLTEIELMASQQVSDLAARSSHGILAAIPQVQYLAPDRSQITPETYRDCWTTSQLAGDLIAALRNAMRAELGLGPVENTAPGDPAWPWLTDRPPDEHHPPLRSQRDHPSAQSHRVDRSNRT